MKPFSFLNIIRWHPACTLPPDHLLLDSAPNLIPLMCRWEINKFKHFWQYKSVRILEVLKLLFQQFLDLSSSQRDVSGPILGDLSNSRWSGSSSRYNMFSKQRTPVSRIALRLEWQNTGLTCCCHKLGGQERPSSSKPNHKICNVSHLTSNSSLKGFPLQCELGRRTTREHIKKRHNCKAQLIRGHRVRGARSQNTRAIPAGRWGRRKTNGVYASVEKTIYMLGDASCH
jgi:hypothetical protein